MNCRIAHFLTGAVLLFSAVLTPTLIGQTQSDWDFGDAPDPTYPTLMSSNGARHERDQEFDLRLGGAIDREPDGQPTASSDGDDGTLTGANDEDGIVFLTDLIPGQVAEIQVTVTSNVPGRLNAWIDWNANGNWTGERIITDASVSTGTFVFMVSVPATAVLGKTVSRWRLNRQGGLGFSGPAPDGEVEDHSVLIGEDDPGNGGGDDLLDFGDAPDPYPTKLVDNGARHWPSLEFRLGTVIDVELDGQPAPNAHGDDTNPAGVADDEDGVTFPGPNTVGSTADVDVQVTGGGILNAWIDFNGNGDWGDPDEKIFENLPVSAGLNSLTFNIPTGASPGETVSRWRLTESSTGGDYNVGFETVPNEDLITPNAISTVLISKVGDRLHFRIFDSEGFRVVDQSESSISPDRADGLARIKEQLTPFPVNPAFTPDQKIVVIDTVYQVVTVDFVGEAGLGEVEDHQLVITEPMQEQEADLSVQKSDSADPVNLGDTVTYTLTVNNAGPSTATGVVVEDQLPDGMTFVMAEPAANCSYDSASHTVSCNLGSIPSGGSATVQIEVTANKPGQWNNQTRVTGSTPDPNPGNNQDGENTVVRDDQPDDCDFTGNKSFDFWVTFPGNYAPDPRKPVRPRILVVGPENTMVTMEIAGLNWTRIRTIPASMHLGVDLPIAADLASALDVVQNLGVHITADERIAVFGMNLADFSSDGFLALPTETLGREYFVQGFRNVHSAVPELNGSQFAVVATEPETVVTITLPYDVLAYEAGVPFDITLPKEGDTYQLRYEKGFPRDVSGTHLIASKPIGVFGGHECGNVPGDEVFFCDTVFEMLLPTTLGGTEFAAASLATRTEADTYRVLALEGGTTVEIEGGATVTLDRGEIHRFRREDFVHLTSNRPVLFTQFANSSDFDGVDDADPFMMNIPAVDQWLDDYMICAPDLDFTARYLNLVIPAGDVTATLMDGVAVATLGTFEPLGSTGYEMGRILVTPGVKHLTGPSPFGLTVYGWALYESFGFPGGMLFGDVSPPLVTCREDTVVRQLGNDVCLTRVPNLTNQVTVEDNCPLQNFDVTQDPPPNTMVGPGIHIITLYAEDARGNVGFCEVVFEVIGGGDPNQKLEIRCPKIVIERATQPTGVAVQFDVRALAGCGEVEVTCDPPSGSVFPLGTTIVRCEAFSGGEIVRCQFPVRVGFRKIEVVQRPDKLILDWPEGGGVLEVAEVLEGPWRPVENFVRPPHEISIDKLRSRFFFRVRHTGLDR